MITDMERIGDQAADISGIVIYLAGTPYIKRLEHLPQMADAAIRMVKGSIDAYVRKDLALTKEIIDMDDIKMCIRDRYYDFATYNAYY